MEEETPQEEQETSIEEPADNPESTEQEEDETPQEEAVPKKEFDKVFARAKKAEEMLKKYKEAGHQEPAEGAKLENEKKEKDDIFEVMAENLSVMRDLTNEELREMRTQAKELGVHPVSFIKSAAGRAYLNSFRQKQKVAQATPAPTNRGNVLKKAKDYDKMTPEEKEAAYGFKAWKERKMRSGQS